MTVDRPGTKAADLRSRRLKGPGARPEKGETLATGDTAAAVRILDGLKAMGLRVSVDDFGTGYSSLSYLKPLPLSALKIDRSFLKGVPDEDDPVAITAAIVSLAHNLRLEVIAEGVETHEQLRFLRERGCDEAQGYLFSRPMPADRFPGFVADRTTGLLGPSTARRSSSSLERTA